MNKFLSNFRRGVYYEGMKAHVQTLLRETPFLPKTHLNLKNCRGNFFSLDFYESLEYTTP